MGNPNLIIDRLRMKYPYKGTAMKSRHTEYLDQSFIYVQYVYLNIYDCIISLLILLHMKDR